MVQWMSPKRQIHTILLCLYSKTMCGVTKGKSKVKDLVLIDHTKLEMGEVVFKF